MTEDLTIAELIARWRDGVSKGTLANWRSSGRGPGWKKVGSTILYPLAGVIGYERSRASDGDSRYFKPGKAPATADPLS